MDLMRERATRYFSRGRDTFVAFTAGQKAVVIIGTLALLAAAVMVFRWASTPSYSPLYSGLSGKDASAVVDELQSQGVPYKITGGGGTIMVPQSDVYTSRITLSGKGLPSASGGEGYSLLDDNGLSTSEFQQQTDFKRAMEGELANTIEAIDGINTAIVHLAIPQKQVFSDEQDPTTASVLISTTPGTTVDQEQVQAIVQLVASSIDGLDPKNVTVSDSTGQVLTIPDDGSGMSTQGTQSDAVAAFSNNVRGQVQSMLDKVVGPGNSSITVLPVLNFDKANQVTRKYLVPKKGTPPLSESYTKENYNGAGGANNLGGVVGPDGQMDPNLTAGANGDSTYENSTGTKDNPVGEVVEHREQAPGSVSAIHLGVALNQAVAGSIQPQVISNLISSGIGIDPKRGDTITVSTLPFDQTAATAAAKELAAAEAAQHKASQQKMIRNVGIGGLIALMLLLAWLQSRRRAAAREEATEYLVEQLRSEQAHRHALENQPPVPAIEAPPVEPEDNRARDELLALVEKQPDDVAALLRGWLVEPR